MVGAVFGAVFVVVNAGSPLDTVTATLLRVVACAAAASVMVMWFLTARRERSAPEEARRNMFSRGYLAVVAAEAILLFGGLRALAALGHPEQANVAWVAFVVGVHFIALAPVWKDRSIAVPGAVLTLLGVAGLVLAATAAVAWVPLVSGVLSGVVLLGGAVTFGWRAMAARTTGTARRTGDVLSPSS
ncbi:hypothetical protein GCM10010140_41940 [Streptosporangium pseudovulgare]|uniref:Uncharacterized protein n=1 Tax=Streptosporangium pseudovulgare TaxID=35765 RepID=A0ABQ2R0I4_9ACTN|nr:hypothetical protein GCM10010140_41940 [Streptosporangium pseudovulgare]